MDLSRPFIRLPYRFDAERLASEVNAIADSAWMAHPNRMQGNTAAALISRDGGDNDDFEGAMAETGRLASSPYIRQVLASFDLVLGRSRLMKLAAGCEVATHVDFNYHWYSRVRIHVPIITNEAVTFRCADQHTHMRAGEAWIFNSWRRHSVTNASDQDRVHLVIDTGGSASFWNTVAQMESLDSLQQREEIDAMCQQVPFDSAATVNLRCEKYNVAPVMAPGEVDALVADLLRDFEHNPENSPDIVARYRHILFALTKDWRETWAQYGYESDGSEHYQAILDRTLASLHPDRRAVVTQSNKIGVNPIIVQRILRSALAPHVRDQFVSAG
ncbi:MAG: aspartyl/asparaginyl beta-hydroxylase domain-containing protein [Pseudomonadota bacterium]